VGYEDRALISPPELQGNDDWNDQVGTGPFMLKEYVPGSYMLYERNPLWWQTETINGVEYELPFADEMMIPFIADVSTTIAALRTGRLDFIERVEQPSWWDSLDETPGIMSRKGLGTGGSQIDLLNTVEPFDNINVRRALWIGTDIKEFVNLTGVSGLPLVWYPYWPEDSSVYIPLEEYPEDIQMLYDYNPTLARQMLDAEDIPEGFTIELNCISTDPVAADTASLVKAQWAKIGIDVEIKLFDAASIWAMRVAHTYKQAQLTGWESADAVSSLLRTYESGTELNYPDYSNPLVDGIIDQIKGERDVSERIRLAKEAYEIVLSEAAEIPLQPITQAHYWWPWLKNYYGESNVGDWGNPMPVLAHAWIDEAMKAEMGY